MRKWAAIWVVLAGLVVVTPLVLADNPLAQGEAMFAGGDLNGAVAFFAQFVQAHAAHDQWKGKALLLLGQSLERNLDAFNTQAEKQCYRSGSGGGACMQRLADQLNAKYGAGTFAYAPEIVVLRYTGNHYRMVADGWKEADLVSEARYRLLEKDLLGKPDEVLGRINAFLGQYGKGEWGRKARLLRARINEDIWWIHRNWAWLLYNWNYSEDELIIRGEKYRKAALADYEAVMKAGKSSEEGKAAKREYELVKVNKSDGVLHGIVNESMVGTTKGK